MYVTDKLIELRKYKNLTQKKVADHIGINYVTYNRLEKGLTKVTPEIAEKLADIYDIDVNDILSCEPLPIEPTPAKLPTIKVEMLVNGRVINYTDIVNKAISKVPDKDAAVNIFIKPEENMVYFTQNGIPGSFKLGE